MQPTININMTTTHINVVQVNGHVGDHRVETDRNKKAWDTIADWWEQSQTSNGADGNDMFTQCLLPEVEKLANWQDGESVLDLGAGSGIICRLFAAKGAKVTGLDYSELMLEKARKRSENKGFKHQVEYAYIDLMDFGSMQEYASKHG